METLTLFKQAMMLVVVLSAPPLIVAVVVGVITSLLQAVMQLQDQTLPFA
ncbi:EscS/YscS/HrcS family type III secretion system export apparatus protein, partial [Pseudomonas viridiflava]